MQIAALLSDLNSLTVCPPEAALSLVSVHKTRNEGSTTPVAGNDGTTSMNSTTISSTNSANDDPNLSRATEVVGLHYNVKMRHVQSGLDPDLLRARRDVDRVVAALKN